MDRHVASSKSLETESAGHLEECEDPGPFPYYGARRAAHHVRSCSIIYVLPDRADAPTEDQTRQEPVPICRRKNRRWHRTAKNKNQRALQNGFKLL